MLLTLTKILPVFLLIVTGFLLKKLNIISNEIKTGLNDIVLKILLPCMLFYSMVTKEFTADSGSTILFTSLVGVGIMSIFPLFTLLLLKLMGIKEKGKKAVFAFACMTENTGLLGIPITNAVFGSDALFVIIILNTILTLYLFSIGLMTLHKIGGSDKERTYNVLSSLLNPNIIASLLGLAFMLLGLGLPDIILEPVKMLGDASTPLSMILVGALLGAADLRGIFGDIRFCAMSVLKMTLYPLLALGIIYILPISAELKLALCFSFTFPVGIVVGPLCEQEGYDGQLASGLVCLTTLISVFTTPLWAAVLSNIF